MQAGTWPGAGWWTAAPTGRDKGTRASCRNARAISQQPGKTGLECLHAQHEGAVCFRGRTTLKKYLRGIGDEWETELNGQGASPLSSVGQRRQLMWSLWELIVSQDSTFYLGTVSESRSLFRRTLKEFCLFFSYLCLDLFKKSKV